MSRLRGVLVLIGSMAAGCGGDGLAAPTPPANASASPSPTPAPAPAAPSVRVADLRGVNGHFTRGTARLIPAGGRHRLELGEDFATNGSRTIDIYLTNGLNDPRPSDLNAGPLTSRTGAHTFDLGSADVSGYSHVLVWCRPFGIPIGIGELAVAP